MKLFYFLLLLNLTAPCSGNTLWDSESEDQPKAYPSSQIAEYRAPHWDANNIFSIAKTNNRVWFSTMIGLKFYDKDKDKWGLIGDLPPYRLMKGNDNLLVGAMDKMVDYINPRTGEKISFSTKTYLSHGNIRDIDLDKDDIWVTYKYEAEDPGPFFISKLNPRTRTVRHYNIGKPPDVLRPLRIRSIGNDVWMITAGQIARFDKTSGITTVISSNVFRNDMPTQSYYEDENKTAISDTKDYLYFNAGKHWTAYDKKTGAWNNKIVPHNTEMSISYKDFVWIGTSYDASYSSEFVLKYLKDVAGDWQKGLYFPKFFLTALLPDDDSIWIGTTDKIVRFRPETGKIKFHYTKYKYDSLQQMGNFKQVLRMEPEYFHSICGQNDETYDVDTVVACACDAAGCVIGSYGKIELPQPPIGDGESSENFCAQLSQARDKNYFWMGLEPFHDRLFKYNYRSNKWSEESLAATGLPELPQRLQVQNGALWAFVSNGLYIRDGNRWRLELPYQAYALTSDGGKFFAFTEGGFFRKDKFWVKLETPNFSGKNDSTMGILKNRDILLLIDGIPFLYRQKSNTWMETEGRISPIKFIVQNENGIILGHAEDKSSFYTLSPTQTELKVEELPVPLNFYEQDFILKDNEN